MSIYLVAVLPAAETQTVWTILHTWPRTMQVLLTTHSYWHFMYSSKSMFYHTLIPTKPQCGRFYECLSQWWGSVTSWCGSGSADSYLWLTDQNPTPDLTPFFSSSKDAKKNSYIFFIIYPQSHYLQSLKFNFLLKFCVKVLFCKHYFSPLNTFIRKEKDPAPDLYPLSNGSGSGRPKYFRFRIPNIGLS
jgi:hypothetical protein